MVHKQKYSGVGLVVYGLEQESEDADKKLMESFKNNDLYLRHVSFKFSSKEGIFKVIRINYQHKNKMWFELLKGVNVEDEVKYKGE